MKLQKESIKRKVNSTFEEIPQKTLWEDFLLHSTQNPERIALYWMEQEEACSMSYGRLKDHALAVAAYLKEKGIKEKDLVGISLPRGWTYLAVLLGIHFVGAAYVPLRYEQPIKRKVQMCKKAGVKGVFIHEELPEIESFSLKEAFDTFPLERPCQANSLDLAYIIFTSGSTGEPKGVMISHDQAYNTIVAVNQRAKLQANDCVLCVSSMDFDLSVFDVFGMLSLGGSMVLLNEKESREAAVWVKLIKRFGVTLWNSVPKLWEMLLAYGRKEEIASIRTVFLSGDWIRPELIRTTEEVVENPLILAMGGATETSIWSNYYLPKDLDTSLKSVPYGYPLANQCFRITDDQGRDLEDEKEGNLWIGGRGVALGYVGEEALTNERFCELDGKRWYFTGDMGKYDAFHNIIFLGRKDHQVKLRGYRVELGEVEHHLSSLLGMKAYAWVEEKENQQRLLAAYKKEFSRTKSFQGKRTSRPKERYKAVASSIHGFLGDLLKKETFPSELSIPRAWRAWLEEYVPEVAEDVEFRNKLEERRESFVLTAKEELSPYWLVEDRYFSLQQLHADDPLARSSRAHLLNYLKQQATKEKKIALLNPDLHLVEELKDVLVHEYQTVCWFTSVHDLQQMSEKVKGLSVELLTNFLIKEGEEHSYDLVLASHVLHRFKHPSSGVELAHGLLKTGGTLLMLEQESMPAVGLISGLLLETGFKGYQGRHKLYSPMLEKEEWLFYLDAGNFRNLDVVDVEEGLFFVLAQSHYDKVIPSSKEMTEGLKEVLPSYMIPEKIMLLYEEPLSSNGKLAKHSLIVGKEEPKEEKPSTFTAAEKEIADLWRKLLGNITLGRNSSFFECGGDSLMATKFLSELRLVFDISLSLGDMLEKPKLYEIASFLEERLLRVDLEVGEL